ncbi:hypothetical protein K450DRAFT_235591 [Umbelopsis ramanniana AG]|uniref:Carrier domain-containing protein n=1 Tax=Umbelopsis ramanniana AG TaxID=1314678 RepID=A0AAD5HFI1_UMBRA|nr:uncharacterized protein K450DRAFT_235591 [Umbelopsis ramanniana AG]KAI8580711.1 hypothetical protein K450DRAFT_235591 [Umbelopsis ramanniana AG]
MDEFKFKYPLDQYHTVNQLFAAITEKFSSSTYIQYWKDPDDEHPCSLTYREVDIITSNLAHRLQNQYDLQGQALAYLADNSLQYGLYLLAFVKLECRVMLLSPKNSETAMVDLMKRTDTKFLVHNKRFAKESSSVIDQIDGGTTFLAFDVDTEETKELDNGAQSIWLTERNSEVKSEKIAFIIHSSGTTGFPKPIYLSNRYMLHMLNNYANLLDVVESPKLLSLAPMYHIMGAIFFGIALIGGTYVFPTNFPPLATTITDSLRKSQANSMMVAPILLEQLAQLIQMDATDVDVLKNVKLAFFGGAPLQQQAGNILMDHGMNIKSSYGSTEMGLAATADPDANCKEFTPMKIVLPSKHYVMEDTDYGSEIKQLIILPNSPFMATNASNRPDGSYATNDVWTPHPSKPGYWFISGRADDTLIMSNGEKTNPVPMEAAMRNSNALIEQCAVIGQSRAATSVLVQLNVKEAMGKDIYDMLSIVEAAVDKANRDAPAHSKIIFPDMVKVLPLIEKLPVTDKGTLSRKKAEKQYGHYLEVMYDNFFNQSSELQQDKGDTKLPLEPTVISDFLKTTIAKLIKVKPSEVNTTMNVFDQGLDSLLAVQLRNSIVKFTKNVPTNFVFQNSTIKDMTQAICQDLETDVVEASYQATRGLLSKYIKLIDEQMPRPTRSYQTKNRGDDVVVLTGATGSLGALVLQAMLQNKSIRKVYALVRGKDGRDRLKKAFSSRALDTRLLKSAKLQVYPFDQAKKCLGLDRQQYRSIQTEATVICHCAWMLDFLQPVTYYEKECINGLFNLLQLAYNGGNNSMRFHFISSVSASMAMKGEVFEQPLPDDPSCAAPMGYAQSKFIAEHLMRYVTQNKGIQGYVERVGQMSGDTVNGYWNPQEQYPLMVAGGAVYMKKMPIMNSEIDWIPLDYSAAAILEIIMNTANDAPSPTGSIFHIVNPNRVTWMDFLEALHANGLKFSHVSPEEWINELSEDDRNPAFKLISFYQDVVGGMELPVWVTSKTQSVSRKLKATPQLDAALVGKCLQNWKRIGLFN